MTVPVIQEMKRQTIRFHFLETARPDKSPQKQVGCNILHAVCF